MNLTLVLFFILTNLCINHPNLVCFAISNINRVKVEKIKKMDEFQAILDKTNTGAAKQQS